MFQALSRWARTALMAMTQMADWMNPRNQPPTRRPRTRRSTRSVSRLMSTTRNPKITRGSQAGSMDRDRDMGSGFLGDELGRVIHEAGVVLDHAAHAEGRGQRPARFADHPQPLARKGVRRSLGVAER